MNLARPKPGTDHLCITACFYMLFAAILLFLFTTAPGSASITKPLFRSKFPIPVKHRLTIFSFLPVSLASSIFSTSSSPDIQHTTYDIPSSNFPPSCAPMPPSCTPSTPSCAASTPSNAATTPCFPPWVPSLPVFQPRATVSGCQGYEARERERRTIHKRTRINPKQKK